MLRNASLAGSNNSRQVVFQVVVFLKTQARFFGLRSSLISISPSMNLR